MVRLMISFAITLATLAGAQNAQGAAVDGTPELAAVNSAPFQVAELRGATRPAAATVRLDLFRDNGLVVEFAVSCGGNGGMLTYSRGEGLFCDPQMRCSTSRRAVIAAVCRN